MNFLWWSTILTLGVTLSMAASPMLFLTVSSLADSKTKMERQLELNWKNIPQEMANDPFTYVGLYNQDPSNNLVEPLVKIRPSLYPDMYFRTNLTFPRQEFTNTNLKDQCMGFWIGLTQGDRLIASNCKWARPNWMWNMKEVIGDRSLMDLFLPGTHNSGSYEKFVPSKYDLVKKFTVCHDEDIWDQLAYGIRYIDLRVMYSSGANDPYWIAHDIFRMNQTLRDVLQQVRRFMDATNEIVILDFHRFPVGFTGNQAKGRHAEVMQMVEDELKNYMIPRSYGYYSKLNQLWDSNKRLLVGYASNEARNKELFWEEVSQMWGDAEKLDKLKQFFDSRICVSTPWYLWSAMAQLTPTFTGIVLGRYGGLRDLAQVANLQVTSWFRDTWWRCTNIVAVDFFLGSDIIEAAIDANRRKFANTEPK